MKKDNRSYKNFQYWPTKKLLEIINEPYNRGINGHDYQPYIEEIQQIYWERLSNQNFDRMIENCFDTTLNTEYN